MADIRHSDTAWFAQPMIGWTVTREHIAKPWPRESAISDLRWWQSAALSPSGAVRFPTYDEAAADWGWTEHQTRKLMQADSVWSDPSLSGDRLARWTAIRDGRRKGCRKAGPRRPTAPAGKLPKAAALTARSPSSHRALTTLSPWTHRANRESWTIDEKSPAGAHRALTIGSPRAHRDHDTRAFTAHSTQHTAHSTPSADQRQATAEPAAPVETRLSPPPGAASGSPLIAPTARPDAPGASTPAPLALTAPGGKQARSRRAPPPDSLTVSPVAEAVLAAWASNPNRGAPKSPASLPPTSPTIREIDKAVSVVGADVLIRRVQAAVRDPWVRGLPTPLDLSALLRQRTALTARLDMAADGAEITPTPEGWRTGATAAPAGSPWDAMLAREERLRKPRSGGHPWLHEGGTGWRWPDPDEHERFRRAFLAAGGWPVWCEADERGQQRFKAAFDAAWSNA